MLFACLLGACAEQNAALNTADQHALIDPYAERYVELLIAYEPFDDWKGLNYFGPPERRERVKALKLTREEIATKAAALKNELTAAATGFNGEPKRRVSALVDDLDSLAAEIEIKGGKKLSLDEDARRRHGAVIAPVSDARLRELRAALDAVLPGKGSLDERYAAYYQRVRVLPERVPQAIRVAHEQCRRATLARLSLPEDNGVELVFDPDAFNTGEALYDGGFRGRIIFSGEPMSAMGILALACHEGYPGHYLFALLRECRAKAEHYPELFAWPWKPTLFLEGAADFAYEAVLTPRQQREALAHAVLPAAGLDPGLADPAMRVFPIDRALKDLAAAEGARRMLAGEMTRAQAETWMREIAVMTPRMAELYAEFPEQQGSYALVYAPGLERLRARVEAAGGTRDNPDRRWQAYLEIIDDPWPR
jgi:hypothetical protein